MDREPGQTSNLIQIINFGKEQNPQLKDFDSDQIEVVARQAVAEMRRLEEFAKRLTNPKDFPLSKEDLARMKAIWIFSAPGKASYIDTYIKLKHAGKLDWERLKMAELICNQYQALGLELPYVVYNGRLDENARLRKHLEKGRLHIPPEKLHIIDDERIKKTVDQMKIVNLPEAVSLEPEDRIGLLSHAPHLVRVLYLLNHFQPFSSKVEVQALPAASPPRIADQYRMMETSGILYYAFISGDAAKEPISYHLAR